MENLVLRPFVSQYSYVFDFLFVVMLLFSTFAMFHLLSKNCGSCAVLRKHFTWTNMLSWASIIWGWGNVIGFVIQNHWRTGVTRALENYTQNPTPANALILHYRADIM